LIVMPPLVISEAEVDEVLDGLDAALAATAAR
jgi:adenosylmethionine-8-amino-7-oxononanoate aminotransferase